MLKSMAGVAPHPIGASNPAWLDASLAWFEQALLDDDADVTAAFFELEPRAQLIAVDVMRSTARAALRMGGFDTPTFVAASAERYRGWLAGDEGS